MEQAAETLPIKQGLVLDILETNAPALSATSDMPVIETKPDSSPPEKEVKEAVAQAETDSETATETTEEQPGAPAEVKKPPRGVQKRLDELVKQREEAKAQAEAEKAEKLRLLALLEARKEPEKTEVTDLVKPDRNGYADPDAYEEALVSYVQKLASKQADERYEALRAEEAKKAEETARQQAEARQREEYTKRMEKAREKYPDFEEVAQSPDVRVPMPVVHAIMTLEQGPDLQYYFGKNPAEAERLSSYQIGDQPDVARQLLEVGRILAKLNEPVKVAPVSNAPAPIKPVRTSGTTAEKDPQNMSMEQYAAYVRERDKGRR